MTDGTLEQQASTALRGPAIDNILTIAVENDNISGKGTDEHYTSGVRLTYLDVGAGFPDIAHRVADLVPTFSINETSSIFYSLGQNLYTPDDISQRRPDSEDRPWAGYLYASMGMVTLSDNHMDELEVSLGVVGPAALGEQAQKFIHNHITGSPSPKGWSSQLKNEPALMLGWQRSFPAFLSAEAMGLRFSAAPYGGAMLGNVYTLADAGLSFRLGPESERWQDTPSRVRPALPGTGFFEIPEKGWSWFLFAGLEGRAVARNIFLDGNTFRDSHSVDKRYLTGDASAGLALTYGRARISYTLVRRLPEFRNQDEPDIFGALSLGLRF